MQARIDELEKRLGERQSDSSSARIWDQDKASILAHLSENERRIVDDYVSSLLVRHNSHDSTATTTERVPPKFF